MARNRPSGPLESGKAKICYLLAYLEAGGAQQQLRELLLRLDRSRFQPRLVGFRTSRMEFLPRLQETGVPLVLLPKRRGFDPSVVFRLFLLLRRMRPDLIHTIQTAGNRYGITASLLARVPLRVSSERYFYPWERPTRRHALLDRSLGWRTDRILANSRYVEECFSRATGVPREKIEVIYNGHDTERLAAVADDEQRRQEMRLSLGLRPGQAAFAMIARLSAEKDHETLLRGVRRLAAEGRDFQVLLAGEGPRRKALERAVQEMNLASYVFFLGYRTDTAAIAAAVEVTVLTSTTESLANALIESMLCATPVVATAVGGNPEIVTDGATGFLVAAGDDGALAGRLRLFLDAPRLSSSMGRRAQEDAARRFDAREMVQRTEGVYRRLLGWD